MSILQEWAHALGGEVVGRQVLCPGPGHSAGDRSLSVWQSTNAPGGFRTHSHAGDDFQICRDHVSALIGAALFRPGAERAPVGEKPAASPPPTSHANIPYAQEIWRRRVSIRGTVAEAYLARRIGRPGEPFGLDLDHVCGFVADARIAGERHPCLVTLCTDPATNEPTGGVHRTFLTADAHKNASIGFKGRASLAPAGIARLWPNEEVTHSLFLAEGIETALAAAFGLGLAPMWACLSAGGIERFPVLAGIETLTVVADHDAKGAGERAARAVCRRWSEAGREASFLMRDDIGDAADVFGAAA